ncbi:nucleotidyl transferase AbiEii/AbiGii toxin family protein [bacterium]|nr:nucleotidyl transferase AbiEii/AbiGii toxin family protein [bacterium]MBU4362748.1 nucleotidyl transferase AbiEii/AbiGii toxin family protein [bacterium]MBU4603002.1 nucleotidyl transferase AbiEii/AbiGii toxin family protein [bacterium]MCG2762583.1 nucleotidyl transferase AbiEii/AbiGii toxin family protein [Candidatus Atribacteria bacterium]MCG2821350.1 nucleotidyl transferase AbiEii/AbiGii toxin family protein [Candidatus Atribacteria bacterium]
MDKKILKDVIYYLSDKQGFVASVIEKDFHLTRILNGVNKYLSTDIVFKGGTLLNKVYLDYHRLSEDLDFAYRRDADLSTRGKRSKAIMPIREKIPAFLDMLELTSNNPQGKGFNNSTQYLFNIQYQSVLSDKKENIKLEISLRQPPFLEPERVAIKHFFQDPFTGEDLIEQGKVLALSLEESVAEKLKAAISRLMPVIRDYYDLGHFIRNGFDFNRSDFLKMVDKKLCLDGYERDYSHNLGLSEQVIKELKRSINANLVLMIRKDEKFDLDEVLVFFNELFKNR